MEVVPIDDQADPEVGVEAAEEAIASGLEVGIVIFKVDELVGRYGHDH